MLKKYIALGILSLSLTCGYAQTELGPAQIDAPVEYVEPEGQEDVVALAVPSEETNTVEVSQTARRMRQLEKAENLKENDSFGGSLTLIAMVIVISALIILSLLFTGFGKISQYFITRRKHATAAKVGKDIEDYHPEISDGQTIAAIGMALAEHFGQGHDIEDTILTIHQIKKSYSPWNSKIYNLRAQPELRRNIHK